MTANLMLRSMAHAPTPLMVGMLMSLASDMHGLNASSCRAFVVLGERSTSGQGETTARDLVAIRDLSGKLRQLADRGCVSAGPVYAYSQAAGWVLLLATRPALVPVEVCVTVAHILAGLGPCLKADPNPIADLAQSAFNRLGSPVLDLAEEAAWLAEEVARLQPTVDPAAPHWRLVNVVLWLLVQASAPGAMHFDGVRS